MYFSNFVSYGSGISNFVQYVIHAILYSDVKKVLHDINISIAVSLEWQHQTEWLQGDLTDWGQAELSKLTHNVPSTTVQCKVPEERHQFRYFLIRLCTHFSDFQVLQLYLFFKLCNLTIVSIAKVTSHQWQMKEWVQSISGMTITRETWTTGRQDSHSANLFTTTHNYLHGRDLGPQWWQASDCPSHVSAQEESCKLCTEHLG
jgi:hypothetical protein